MNLCNNKQKIFPGYKYKVTVVIIIAMLINTYDEHTHITHQPHRRSSIRFLSLSQKHKVNLTTATLPDQRNQCPARGHHLCVDDGPASGSKTSEQHLTPPSLSGVRTRSLACVCTGHCG